MKVLSLHIENILSIEKADIEFDDSGLVLVEGWNYDIGRANGAGKTAIFNAMSFALYDKVPRKITATEIVRRTTKSGLVTCKVQIGESVWTVTRTRPKGVSFLCGDEVKNITQEEWETKLRLTYEQFLMSMYTAQSSDQVHSRFLMKPDADKKTFLLQLLNLNIFDACRKATNDRVNELESKLREAVSRSGSDQARVQAYSESLIDENVVIEEFDLAEVRIQEWDEEKTELSSVLKPDLSKYAKMEDDIREKTSMMAATKMKRSHLHDKYRELLASVADFDEAIACKECGASLFTPEAKLKHEAHQADIQTLLIKVKEQIDSCDAALSREQAIKDLSVKLHDKKTKDSALYDKAFRRIMDLDGLIKTQQVRIAGLNLKLEQNTELVKKIQRLSVSIEAATQEMALIKHDLEFYRTVYALYSPTGAQAYVLDSIIDFFNTVVSNYVTLLWPSASYTLISYRETAKGDVVAKFSEILTIDGCIESVGSLSGGELKALSLCVDFALLDVLETQFGMQLNPVILDEPYDGLDASGKALAIDLLKKLSVHRQILVVDHASEVQSMFSKVIRVEKRDGISSVSLST